MLERLAELEARYEELSALLTDPAVVSDHRRVEEIARERSALEDVVRLYREYQQATVDLDETRQLAYDDDQDVRELAREEVDRLEADVERLEQALRLALLPKDPADERNVIVEIRAGAGGDEAGLFAYDLFRMYQRYAERLRWGVDILNTSANEAGGYREIVFEITGRGAYSRLKYESGVHRVQRVPETETQGRIHTSTATVAVMPEVDEVDVEIDWNDVRIDIFHSGGAGGQNVNKVATAVRMTHNPTGIVVTCQDERSQAKNRAKAEAVLRARLYELEREKQDAEQSASRRSQVGSGDRAEKIRTYNFPQDRITDHRIGLTIHGIARVLDGEIDQLIDAVSSEDQARLLAAAGV
jgi:peptide chain release factor 1